MRPSKKRWDEDKVADVGEIIPEEIVHVLLLPFLIAAAVADSSSPLHLRQSSSFIIEGDSSWSF